MPGTQQSIVIHAPVDVVYGVIVDYEKYPQFLSDVSAVKVISRAPGTTVMEQTLSLVKEVTMRLRLTETPHSAVSWVTETGSRFLKKNDGSWKLEDLGDGTTRATYGLDVEVGGIWVPQAIVDKLTGGTLPKTLQAFKARAEAAR
jgi:ribosome-associated toxin RatA of RatAB toxin-antitoxin module